MGAAWIYAEPRLCLKRWTMRMWLSAVRAGVVLGPPLLHERAVAAVRVAGVDQRRLVPGNRRIALRAHRIDGLKCGGGERAEQLDQMCAALHAAQQFARPLRPACLDALADQSLVSRRRRNRRRRATRTYS